MLEVKDRGVPEADWVVLSHSYMDFISRSLWLWSPNDFVPT